MLRNGFRRKFPNDKNRFNLFYSINDLHRIYRTRNVSEFIKIQQRNYAAHLVRSDNKKHDEKTAIPRRQMYETWSKHWHII